MPTRRRCDMPTFHKGQWVKCVKGASPRLLVGKKYKVLSTELSSSIFSRSQTKVIVRVDDEWHDNTGWHAYHFVPATDFSNEEVLDETTENS
jgi:hypothetical protein